MPELATLPGVRGRRTFYAIRRAAAIATPVFVCAIGALYLLVGDRTPWGEWLTIWPPLGWAVLFTVRALILWLEGWRSTSLATVGLSLVFLAVTEEPASLLRRPNQAVIAELETRRLTREGEGPVPLRVVSWNVAGRAPLDELQVLDPDIAILQEIGGVAAAMKGSGHWKGFHWSSAFDPGTLSRYPAQVIETAKVGPWTAPQLLVVTLPNGNRLLVANVRLVLPAIVVSVASLGDFGNVVRGHRDRVDQFPRLVELLRTAAARHDADAILLAGDFNTPGGMPSLRPLKALLRDVWSQGGTGWGGTMTADMPVSRIDQCWVSDGIRVASARVRAGKASDHRMLVVDLLVGPPAGR